MADQVPSADEQVRFLRNIQRLFAEGSFVASYKFALLQSLADLAVLAGDDSGRPLTLQTGQIAERFVDLYWRQVRPFQVRGSPGLILKQNTGQQAAVVQAIAAAHQASEGSLAACKRDPRTLPGLISRVDQTIRVMPLWKLQRVGEQVADFLYDNVGTGTSITLKPGIAYCLRAY